jgi:uncharacterized protein YndB with AHSA1/START domain
MGIQVTTKMKIMKPASEVFEALVDPAKMANYWFSSGSGRWEQGKTITLRYDEYDAQVDVYVAEVQPNRKIVFVWGGPGGEAVVTMILNELDGTTTLVEITQTGWKEDAAGLTGQLLDNKEGWVYMLTCLKAYLDFGVTQLRAALVK